MDVERAEASRVEELARQKKAVGGHDERIGAKRPHALELRRVLQARRLRHGQSVIQREAFDRIQGRAQAAPGRTVGLGQDQGNLVAGGDDARQSSLSELGRAGED